MFQTEVIFNALNGVTPNFAAKLANCASAYHSKVFLSCGGTVLCIDSLISILSMALRRGASVCVSAEGDDARAAVEAVCALLTTKLD